MNQKVDELGKRVDGVEAKLSVERDVVGQIVGELSDEEQRALAGAIKAAGEGGDGSRPGDLASH